MDRTLVARQLLASRILRAFGLVAIAPLAACGGSVVDEGQLFSGAGGGSGGNGASSSSNGAGGTSVASSGVSSSNAASSAVSSGVTTSGVGGSSTTSSGMMCGGTAKNCFDWPYDSPCPAKEQAMMYFPNDCLDGCFITSVDAGPFYENGSCCYATTTTYCGVGRPFLVADAVRTAGVRRVREGGWTPESSAPSVDDSAPEARRFLADAWTRDALLEHASVAAFGRFALQLLAVGAPADLLAGAHAAALDEIKHAQICFALAGAYAGAPIAPSPFPFDGRVDVTADLAQIAASTVIEGCIGETLASIQAAEQLVRATDPAVRAVLAVIAEDEARHAELAWRTVAWALSIGGAEVRRAVSLAFVDAPKCLPDAEGALPPEGSEQHGRLEPAALRDALARALDDVVLPCARALLARPATHPDGGRADAAGPIALI